jgi:hypothetical protein
VPFHNREPNGAMEDFFHRVFDEILQQRQAVALGGKILVEKYGERELVKKLIGEGAEMFARSLDRNSEYEADRGAVVPAPRGLRSVRTNRPAPGYRAYFRGCQQHPLALAHPDTSRQVEDQ